MEAMLDERVIVVNPEIMSGTHVASSLPSRARWLSSRLKRRRNLCSQKSREDPAAPFISPCILAFLYLYGFTTWSFNMADLEQTIEGRAIRQAMYFAAALAALAILWRRSPKASEVIFDGSEPFIQTLDLT
jgi:hypothetical protein